MTTLAGVLPELAIAYNNLASFGAAHGISFVIADFGGVRTEADTTRILGFRDADYAAAVKAGTIQPTMSLNRFRPIAPYGSSWHNYGAAFDIRLVSRPSNMTADQAMRMLGAYAATIGLRWGGTFTTNPDPPHFELAIPLEEAKRRYATMTGSALPNIKGGFSSAFDASALPVLVTGGTDSNGVTDYGDEPTAAVLDWPDTATETQTGLLILGALVVGAVVLVLSSRFR